MIRFRLAPTALALSLAAGCVGGQSGDEGLGNDPGGPEVITALAPMRCEGEKAGDPDSRPRTGTCIQQMVDAAPPVFRCDCAEQSGDVEAETCQEALREQCDLELVEPTPPGDGDCLEEPRDADDEDAGTCR